jgi:hypothetical protein
VPRHIARWDLDKTYLRTEFDSLRDLLRTAFERPDQKRTNPGAATLLREMVRANVSVHILSGSPEQMRRRLEDKLRLDGVKWDSFTLKPNLENMLRFRFRALRDQLGYKLPALLRARAMATEPTHDDPGLRKETLFGDDAEADAYVYSLYSDVVAGRVDESALAEICVRGRMYPDVQDVVMSHARAIQRGEIVERIFIHLEKQSPPDDFLIYGPRLIPFYNYLQAAFVLLEDGRVPPEAVLRVAVELVVMHRFDGEALARSYLDLAKRGHLRGDRTGDLASCFELWARDEKVPGADELSRMLERLPKHAEVARASWRPEEAPSPPDYLALVDRHNPRHRRR